MENVVYILGAGFSAPLGLPLMSNFLMKSRDLYFMDREKFTYFEEIFDTIRRMAYIKNFFNSDLYNIEEILSILEIESLMSDNKKINSFKKYISEVITYFTPEYLPYQGRLPNNWERFIFGQSTEMNLYGCFIGNILNLIIHRDKDAHITYEEEFPRQVHYSIITLNYDLVFENTLSYMRKQYTEVMPVEFIKKDYTQHSLAAHVPIAKLHGSAEDLNIIPPTWNKKIDNEILSTWKMARLLLEEANHIRILGYSLPVSDTYIQYLLKTAMLKSSHLKTIDIIGLDNIEGELENRYDRFIEFKYKRFKNANIMEYLEINRNLFLNRSETHKLLFNTLEKAHQQFMGQ